MKEILLAARRILIANPSAACGFKAKAANVYLAVVLLHYSRLYCLSSIQTTLLLVFSSFLSSLEAGFARVFYEMIWRSLGNVKSLQRCLMKFIRMALHCWLHYYPRKQTHHIDDVSLVTGKLVFLLVHHDECTGHRAVQKWRRRKAIIVFVVFAFTMDILSWQAKSISLFCATRIFIHACLYVWVFLKTRLRRALTIYF